MTLNNCSSEGISNMILVCERGGFQTSDRKKKFNMIPSNGSSTTEESLSSGETIPTERELESMQRASIELRDWPTSAACSEGVPFLPSNLKSPGANSPKNKLYFSPRLKKTVASHWWLFLWKL